MLVVVVKGSPSCKNKQVSVIVQRKGKKKTYQGLETSRVSSPILLPLPFLPLIDTTQLRLPIVLLVVVVVVVVVVFVVVFMFVVMVVVIVVVFMVMVLVVVVLVVVSS